MTHFKKYFNALRLLTAIVAVTAATTVQAQYWDLFYDFAGDFHDGLAKVSLNDKWGYLNNLGAEAVQCIYQNAGDFNNGRAKVQRQGKWGFVNVNGAEVIPCKYDEIGPFDEDFMARAKVNGKIGYIGMRGEVIPCIYDEIEPFNDHLIARVTINGKKGLIRKFAENVGDVELAPCKYDYIGDFKDGVFKAKLNGKWGYLDINGNEIIACRYDDIKDFDGDYALVCLNGKYGFVHKSGAVAIPCLSESDSGMKLINGMTKFTVNGKCGVYSTNGNYIVQPEYVNAIPLSNAIIKVESAGEGCGAFSMMGNKVLPCKYDNIEYLGESLLMVKENGKCGIYETTGRKVISPKYDDIEPFSNGLAAVCENGRWGYIDISGKKIINTNFDNAEPYNDNNVAVVGESGYLSLINKFGEIITTNKYNEFLDFVDGKAKAKRNGRWGYVSASGEEIIPCKYDRFENFDKKTGLALVSSNGRQGLVNKNGREITPCQYDVIESFNNDNLAKVMRNGYTGMINTLGQEVVPCEYNTVDAPHENMVIVSKNGMYGYVDLNGYNNIACQYNEAKPFNDGMAAVRKGNLWGYIDNGNRTVIPFQYSEAGTFSNGLANVNGNSYIKSNGDVIIIYQATVELTPEFKSSMENYDMTASFYEGRAAVCRNDLWGFIDTRGREPIPCQYNTVNRFCQKLAAVQKEDKWGYIDINGAVIVPIEMNVADAGMFSEGLAFIAQDMNQPMSYFFINSKGDKVFEGSNLDRNKIAENGFLIFEKIPTFNNGECYIPLYGSNEYAVYNTSGQLVRKESNLPHVEKKSSDYSIFIGDNNKKGLKDSNGNVVIPAKYDEIKTDNLGNPSVSSGVVMVTLLERDVDYPDDMEYATPHYAYADLHGHDTFSPNVLRKIENAENAILNKSSIATQREEGVYIEDEAKEDYPSVGMAPSPGKRRSNSILPPTIINSNEETRVGTLTVYRANSTFNLKKTNEITQQVVFSKRFHMGELICDSNDPGTKMTQTVSTNNEPCYQYERDWGGENHSFLINLGYVSKEEYKFDELLVDEVGNNGVTFVSENGKYRVSIFRPNLNGYEISDWEGDLDYVLTATLPEPGTSRTYNFMCALDDNGTHINLYGHNDYMSNGDSSSKFWKPYCGILYEDFEASMSQPFDAQGNMQTNLRAVDGNNYITIAYFRSEHKLYVNGEWLFLQRK